MAIKTFTTGEVLTASDTNTYLNDAGLVLITSGITVSSAGGTAATVANGTVTIGTNNTSITVSGAFSSTYQSYRIFIDNESTNGTASHLLQLSGITTSVYFSGGSFGAWAAGAQTGFGAAASANFTLSANVGVSTETVMTIDITNPNIARRKFANNFAQAANGHSTFNHYCTSTSTATGFVLSKSGDTMTGGIIRVYGYRQV
jgi:hypothetical protein